MLVVLCLSFALFSLGLATDKPNIIVIVADDMGWNDVGFHGSNEIPTPNIDALAYNGVILNGHYTQALCTPSRSAFLTGKYPIHLGMQHLVILEPEPWGLPLNETLLPQHLKRHGYATHAIGKWHLGFFRKEYTPTYRGFDSHFGYWQGLQDYYKHTVHATFTPEYGYDMRRNMSVDWDAEGKYSTTLFTEEAVKLIREHDVNNPMFMYLAHLAPHTGNDDDPLQAPDEEIAKFAHIADPERRIYAAMVSMLDQGVGKVVAALREKKMLDNSIILFMSDNGAKTDGIHANHGSNYPLRGLKGSGWEGATRGLAAIWSPLIKKPQRVSSHMMHISDWLPTFFSAAGLNKRELAGIDGIDMWKTISEDATNARTDLIYNIDEVWNYGAVRRGDWKYLYGSASKGKEDHWYGSTGNDSHYRYDEVAVLNSEAAAALAGVVTSMQIKEKHLKIKNLEGNLTDFSINLLNQKQIFDIRTHATVKCENPIDSGVAQCNPLLSPCLFNLKEDPCEMNNLADQRPMIVTTLEDILVQAKKTALPLRNIPRDPNADPIKWNGTWTNWQDEEVMREKLHFDVLSPLGIGILVVIGAVFLLVVVALIVLFSKRNTSSNKLAQVLSTYDDDFGGKEMRMRYKDHAFEDMEKATRESFKEKTIE